MINQLSCSYIKDRDAFFAELEREIARVRRYGHRVTLLLIEPEEVLEGEEVERFEQELIKQLRTSDCAYNYGKNLYSAILPDTHEAGGEAAALRLKRRICSALNRVRASELLISIGVMSLDAAISKDIHEVVDELERDLERDRRCQNLPDETCEGVEAEDDDRHSTSEEEGALLFTGCDESIVDSIKRLCSGNFRVSVLSPDEVLKAVGSSSDMPVVVLGPMLLLSEKRDITQKIRFNRKLENTYIIWVQDESMPVVSSDEPDLPCDIMLPSMPETELLWPILRYGFNAAKAKSGCGETGKLKGMLDAISAAAHKLNQPLQIILGRLELLMLNLEDTPENREILEDIKTIRSQALLASDINKKIGRLSKY